MASTTTTSASTPATLSDDNQRKLNLCETVELFKTITELLKKDTNTTDEVLKSQFERLVESISECLKRNKLNWENRIGYK